MGRAHKHVLRGQEGSEAGVSPRMQDLSATALSQLQYLLPVLARGLEWEGL